VIVEAIGSVVTTLQAKLEAQRSAEYSASGKLEQEERPLKPIVGDILNEGDLALLFSIRGIGKTFASLHLAHALATGSNFLKWKAKKRRVLYVDGEMNTDRLNNRLRLFTDGEDIGENLLTTSYNEYPNNRVPDLASKKGQEAYHKLADLCDVLIFDNYSCCAQRQRGDDDISRFGRVRPFLFEMRARGKTVVIVHHAGKSGEQRGTSELEDPQDLIIKLTRSALQTNGYSSFEWHVEKNRNFYGESEKPLHIDYWNVEGRLCFAHMKLQSARKLGIKSMLKRCGSPQAIASYLRISTFEVLAVKSELEAEGEVF
jgi:hypothetical protein